jgi:hypothetical protein
VIIARRKSFRELASDRFVIGTPDEAIKAFEQVERELGVNFIILCLHYVGMSFEAKVRQIRLFGEGVIPHEDRTNKALFTSLPPPARLRRQPLLARGDCGSLSAHRQPPQRPAARRGEA